MSKYIKKFDGHDNYDEFTKTQEFVIPNVSHCIDETDVHYNPKNYNWIKYLSTNGIVPYGGYGIIEAAFNAHIIDTQYDEETQIVTIFFDDKPTEIYGTICGEHGNCIKNIFFSKTMKSIGNGAFSSTRLTSFFVGKNIKHLGVNLFNSNQLLESLAVDEANAVYDSRNNCNAIIETAKNKLIAGCDITVIPEGIVEIEQYAFNSCSFTTIDLPDTLKNINKLAFCYCRNLETITLPDGLVKIGNGAFVGCNKLQNLTLPNSIVSIDADAFSYCSALTSLTLPPNLRTLGNSAFENCKHISGSIVIPNGITRVSKCVFQYCENITSVTIPSSVTEIDDFAFRYCSSLASVTVLATTPPTMYKTNQNYEQFYYNANGRKIYVPADSVNAYRAAPGWSSYPIEAIP